MSAKLLLGLLAAGTLSGCIAHAAYDVGTAPIRVTSKAVDWTTTSRSEADRNRGRRARKECEKEKRGARKRQKDQGGPAQPLPAFCR